MSMTEHFHTRRPGLRHAWRKGVAFVGGSVLGLQGVGPAFVGLPLLVMAAPAEAISCTATYNGSETSQNVVWSPGLRIARYMGLTCGHRDPFLVCPATREGQPDSNPAFGLVTKTGPAASLNYRVLVGTTMQYLPQINDERPAVQAIGRKNGTTELNQLFSTTFYMDFGDYGYMVPPSGTYTGTIKPFLYSTSPVDTVPTSTQCANGRGVFEDSVPFVPAVTMNVTVQPTCALSIQGNVDFGTITDTSTAKLAQGQIGIFCNNYGMGSVFIENGLNPNTNNGRRRMKSTTSATEFLDYQLYRDAGRNEVWYGVNGFQQSFSTNINSWTFLNVYASIPQGATLPALGTYTDVVVVRMEF